MSDIKTFFISRYKDGVILEADFSQLEIIYLAHITKDPQLTKDILDDIDLHTVNAAHLFKCHETAVTKEQRKIAKAFSFMLQYGSGAKHMAEETGHSEQLAREFIKNFYTRYPKVKEWQQKNIEDCKLNRIPIPAKSKKGYPLAKAVLPSETGRRYTFIEGDTPEFLKRKGVHTGFKPTEIKNYPIQGGATGDIVPMILGKINRWIIKNNYQDKAKLIVTVHDSIVLDIEMDMLYTIGNGVKKIMQDAPEYYKEIFGVEFNLPLKVEVTYGESWAEQRAKL